MTAQIVQDVNAAFSEDYFEARQKFLSVAGDVVTFESPARGPKRQPLFTDVAWVGDRDAKHVGVMISSTHGVEGYTGSAAQIDWLRRGEGAALPKGVAVLLIHAINPYGFAWDRRVTEEGCDLNRNFVNFDAGAPANPGYDVVGQYLVPDELSGPVFEEAEKAIAAFRAEQGEWAFQSARKSGQYTDSNGMFFGGFGPTNARKTLGKIAEHFDLKSRDKVIIVDAHTGLGPWGYGELQTEQPSGQDGYDRALSIFGKSVTSPDLGTSSSVPINGSIDAFWEWLLGDRHTYVALEFGTFDPENGRRTLRQDHWLAKNPDANPELARSIRIALRDHYDPRFPDWREMVLWRCRQVYRQMIAGLVA